MSITVQSCNIYMSNSVGYGHKNTGNKKRSEKHLNRSSCCEGTIFKYK